MQRDFTRKLFWGVLCLILVVLAVLSATNEHLKTPAAPAGIISFEVCAYWGSCRSIIDGWGPSAQLMAALNLGGDYLLMVLYPVAICLGLIIIALHVPVQLKKFAVYVAWSAWVSGVADAAENFCLAQMLISPAAEEYAWPAAIFATVKFDFLGFTITWLLVAYVRFVLLMPRPASAL